MSSRAAAPVAARPAEHVPGEVGIWIFVLGDMSVFGLLFGAFAWYRAQDLSTYLASQATLNQSLGVLNTLLLLASSWFVVLGVDATRRPDRRQAPLLFALAFACGIGFGLSKAVEWSDKIRHGITLTTNECYSFYYMLTGLHLVHVVIGMVLLGFMIARTRAPVAKRTDVMFVECGATYWHMVDLLWIVLFPLLYLMR